MGSLIAALASFLDARAHDGTWLVRMEDLDPPREIPGAAQSILNSLQAHGLHWDGEVMWQSQRAGAYDAALEQLQERGLSYRCDCSRARLADSGGIYPGYCREQPPVADAECAIRVKVDGSGLIEVHDSLQQPLREDLARDCGDFIIHRRDGLYAYQLAVVVDDCAQGVTQVLRGSDLYDSTPRQIHLQRLLGCDTPEYTHIPVITNEQGQKLSKQTHAPALDEAAAADNLRYALQFLRQPVAAAGESLETLLSSAVENWQREAIPRTPGIPQSTIC